MRLWDAINTGNTSVARQRAVVAVEREIEAIERCAINNERRMLRECQDDEADFVAAGGLTPRKRAD